MTYTVRLWFWQAWVAKRRLKPLVRLQAKFTLEEGQGWFRRDIKVTGKPYVASLVAFALERAGGKLRRESPVAQSDHLQAIRPQNGCDQPGRRGGSRLY